MDLYVYIHSPHTPSWCSAELVKQVGLVAALWSYVWEVRDSILGRNTGYPNSAVLDFPQSLQTCWDSIWVRPKPFQYTILHQTLCKQPTY
jgi:hypothetical protein